MTVHEWLNDTTRCLKAAGIETARLDTLVLLEDELNKSRTHLLAHPEIVLMPENIKVLGAQLARRVRHEPLAYVRGKAEFYGREFAVSPAVLVPRPESETMIELLLRLPEPRHSRIADVGTGSGALGITAQLELPNAQVDLLEIDNDAIEIARKNVIKFATGTNVVKSNLLGNVPWSYDVLLCNLPYVPDEFTVNQAVQYEPRLAVFGGPDGLDVYRALFEQLTKIQNKPLLILCESLPSQHQALTGIAKTAGYKLQNTDDFIQAFIAT